MDNGIKANPLTQSELFAIIPIEIVVSQSKAKTPPGEPEGAAYYPDHDQRQAGRDPDNEDDATLCG
jgi:hypothetical protein